MKKEKLIFLWSLIITIIITGIFISLSLKDFQINGIVPSLDMAHGKNETIISMILSNFGPYLGSTAILYGGINSKANVTIELSTDKITFIPIEILPIEDFPNKKDCSKIDYINLNEPTFTIYEKVSTLGISVTKNVYYKFYAKPVLTIKDWILIILFSLSIFMFLYKILEIFIENIIKFVRFFYKQLKKLKN